MPWLLLIIEISGRRLNGSIRRAKSDIQLQHVDRVSGKSNVYNILTSKMRGLLSSQDTTVRDHMLNLLISSLNIGDILDSHLSNEIFPVALSHLKSSKSDSTDIDIFF